MSKKIKNSEYIVRIIVILACIIVVCILKEKCIFCMTFNKVHMNRFCKVLLVSILLIVVEVCIEWKYYCDEKEGKYVECIKEYGKNKTE